MYFVNDRMLACMGMDMAMSMMCHAHLAPIHMQDCLRRN